MTLSVPGCVHSCFLMLFSVFDWMFHHLVECVCLSRSSEATEKRKFQSGTSSQLQWSPDTSESTLAPGLAAAISAWEWRSSAVLCQVTGLYGRGKILNCFPDTGNIRPTVGHLSVPTKNNNRMQVLTQFPWQQCSKPVIIPTTKHYQNL